MGEHCSHLDDAATWALHAVPDDELDGVLAHFSACPHCRAEADRLGAAAAVLPASVPVVTPSPALKMRIMADVQREAALLAAAGPEADRTPAMAPARRERRRWSWLPRPALALGGLAAAAVLAVGVVAGTQIDGSGDAGDQAARTIPATVNGSAAANVVLTADHAATLDLHHVAAPPRGKVYQVWLQGRDGSVTPSRTLFTTPKDGSVRVRVAESVRGKQAVLVSAEQPGGSPTGQPTSQPVISAAI